MSLAMNQTEDNSEQPFGDGAKKYILYNKILRLGLCNNRRLPQEGDTTISIKSLYTALAI